MALARDQDHRCCTGRREAPLCYEAYRRLMQKLRGASTERPPGSTSRSRRRGRAGSSGPDVTVYGITTARRSQQADVSTRARRYMISMTIRLVCFVAAFAFYGHWYAWVAALGAVFLPYVAVLMANAGRERRAEPPTAMMPSGTGAGPGGTGQPSAPRALTAVPRRTTPASDPWSDPRSAPPTSASSASSGEPRWQHSYTAPTTSRPHDPHDPDLRARDGAPRPGHGTRRARAS